MSLSPCACISVKFDRSPHGARLAAHDMMCEELASLEKTFDFSKLALHEAGHCVAGAMTGLPARYATVSLSGPHTMYQDEQGDQRVVASIFRTVAGPVSEAVGMNSGWFPSWLVLSGYVARARADDNLIGHCDLCMDARLLVESFQHLTDEKLVENWREMFRLAFDVFYIDDVRGALLSVARALREQTLLNQEEIAEICARYSLPSFKELMPCSVA